MERSLDMKKPVAILLLATIVLCIGLLPLQGTQIAWAAEESGSKVLVDLQKAENFNMDDYPLNPTDYSLEVIHIAESTENELLVYVYQPSGAKANLMATTISISTVVGPDIAPKFYDLEFLNSSGVFYKYKVKDFTVSSEATRVYSVVSILRPFIKDVDAEPGFDNTVSEVPFAVAKEYTFYSGQDNYQMQVLDVVEITDKFVGYVIYSAGIDWYGYDPYFDVLTSWYVTKNSHIVAFSTDKDIDKLLEAEVYYEHQTYHHSLETSFTTKESKKFGTVYSETVVLSSEDKLTYNGEGLLYATGIDVGRIQTVDEFIASVDIDQQVYSGAFVDMSVSSRLTESAKAALSGKEWVLRFADTESREAADINGFFYYYSTTSIFNVSILRLKFETEGEVYNLGVVDNKQTGSNKPMNNYEYNLDFHLPDDETIKNIIAIILVVLIIVVICVAWFYLSKLLAPLKIPLKKWSMARKKARKKRKEERKRQKQELKELKEQEELEKLKGD